MNAFVTCKTTQSMIDKMILLSAKEYFRAKLKIVRYEDLVTYPEKTSLDIFEFLDIPDSDQVINDLKIAAEIKLAQENWKLNHWLWDLKWDDVNRMQTLCPAAFKTLGYTVMDTEDKYKFAVQASHNKMLSFDFFKKNYVVPVGLPTTTTTQSTTTAEETDEVVNDGNLGDNLGQDIVVEKEVIEPSTEF